LEGTVLVMVRSNSACPAGKVKSRDTGESHLRIISIEEEEFFFWLLLLVSEGERLDSINKLDQKSKSQKSKGALLTRKCVRRIMKLDQKRNMRICDDSIMKFDQKSKVKKVKSQ
jgi:hypothetical protein